jgi:hypothetical protein
VVLVGACLAGGLTLTVMVIGSAPTIGGPVSAAAEAVVAEAVAAEPSITAVADAAATEVASDSTVVSVDPAQELLAAPGVVGTATVAPNPAPIAAPAAAPGQVQTTAPRAADPSPQVAPSTPVLTPAPTVAPPTSPPTIPPLTTPTTAPPPTPPPTLPPTTAPPATAPALTYPSYTVSGVAGVSLQFDGSSISVASVSPQANWVYEVATNGPRTVEIKFFNVATGSDREFHATVDGGRIKVET